MVDEHFEIIGKSGEKNRKKKQAAEEDKNKAVLKVKPARLQKECSKNSKEALFGQKDHGIIGEKCEFSGGYQT